MGQIFPFFKKKVNFCHCTTVCLSVSRSFTLRSQETRSCVPLRYCLIVVHMYTHAQMELFDSLVVASRCVFQRGE